MKRKSISCVMCVLCAGLDGPDFGEDDDIDSSIVVTYADDEYTGSQEKQVDS